MKRIFEKFMNLSTKGKIITGIIIFFVICVIVGPFLPDDESGQQPTNVTPVMSATPVMSDITSTTAPEKNTINYTVVDYQDVSMGEVVRKNLRTTISEADLNSMSETDIEQLLKDITQNYVEKHDYVDAVSVMLYCEGDKTNDVYTIAKSEFAPEGDWGKAIQGLGKDYSNYDYSIDIRTEADRQMYRELNKQ